MAITYTLYCKECFDRLMSSGVHTELKARPYESYFVCSRCSFETDRGYAVQKESRHKSHSSNTEKQLNISVG